MNYLAGDHFKRRAITACLETVEVAHGEKF